MTKTTVSRLSARPGVARVLVVDDHPIMRQGYSQLITLQPDLQMCGEAADVQEALRQVQTRPGDVQIGSRNIGGRRQQMPRGSFEVAAFAGQDPEHRMTQVSIHAAIGVCLRHGFDRSVTRVVGFPGFECRIGY